MRRIKLVLMVAAVMAVMLVSTAAPAMARGFNNFGGFNNCFDFNFGCGVGNCFGFPFDNCGFNTGFAPVGFGFNNFGDQDNDCNQRQVFDLNTRQWVWTC